MIEHENIDLSATSIYHVDNLVGQTELDKYKKFLKFEEKQLSTKDMFVSDIRNSSVF